MEFPGLVPVLVSLQLLFPLAAPSAPPPAPRLWVSPHKPRFLIGDSVSLTCSVPGARSALRGFRFAATSGWVSDVRTSRGNFSLTWAVTEPAQGGFHTCSYLVRMENREVRSENSQPVLIQVQDRPAPPNLTVTPSPLTVEGQPLLFRCSAPPGAAAERRFGFFHDGLEITEGLLEGSGGAEARLKVEKSDRNRTGNFSCRYEEMTEGRWIASYASDAVPVEVKGRCPAPVLSVEPPSGVVPAGHRLLLTCSAPRRRFRRRFRFFRDGAALRDVIDDVIGDVTGEEEGAELELPRVSRQSGGNFSCRLEEEVGGAWLEAPPSRGVAMMVTGDFPPPAEFQLLPLAVGVSVGVASLLLGLLLAAWMCRRRRGGSRWRGLRPGDDTGTLRMGDLEVAS